MKILIGMAIGVAITLWAMHSPAHAHDTWQNGGQVDPLTKKLCCGENDCVMIENVHLARYSETGFAYTWFDPVSKRGESFPLDRAQPSPDGFYWRCRWASETQCFFAPPMGY